jgi:hypothetical protein
MFKLRLTAMLAASVLLLSVSCKSAPEKQDDSAKNAQSAQKARDAADRAFMDETGEGIGDEDIPRSLPSSSAVTNQEEPEFVYVNEQGKDDVPSISSFDEPSVMFAMADTAQGEQPEWVKSPQKAFSQSQYLSAVGMGKNTVDAENSAIASIGKIIKQNVSSKVVTTEKDAVSSSGFSSSSSTLDEIIETYSVVDALVGVKIHEFWWGNDGYVYALAYLNKAEAAQYYSRKISENESLIDDRLSFANSRKGSFDAFAAVQKAVRAAEENNQYMDILNAVQSSAYRAKKLSYGSEERVKEAAYDAAMTISIDVSVKGTDDSRIANAVILMLSSYGFRTKLADEKSTAPYIIEADVEFMDVPSERNKYVRYVFNAALKEVSSGKILLPYSENKREGHTSASEAQQKALRTLEKSIVENYAQAFVNYLKTSQ